MIASYPNNLPMPFAENGNKNTIPENTPAGTGALSYASGFPEVTSKPLSAGGIAPERKDFNGALHTLSKWIHYLQAGGRPRYSEEIDYSAGFRIMHEGIEYKCLADNGPSTDAGVQATINADYWQAINDPAKYYVGDYVDWRKADIPSYLLQLNGALIENVSIKYPLLYLWAQQAENQCLLITEEEWQARSLSTHTLATGEEIPIFNGIGGVGYFVFDKEADTLRLADYRGCYDEPIGFDDLALNESHGDMIRNISYEATNTDQATRQSSQNTYTGAMYLQQQTSKYVNVVNDNASNIAGYWGFNSSRVVPTGNANKPRAIGFIRCICAAIPE